MMWGKINGRKVFDQLTRLLQKNNDGEELNPFNSENFLTPSRNEHVMSPRLTRVPTPNTKFGAVIITKFNHVHIK